MDETRPAERVSEELTLYREPVDTPGLIPQHLKRATANAYPLIEVLQRFLFQLKPGMGATVEKAVALIALYKAVAPVWRHLKNFFLHTFTSQISISENDPVAQEVVLWMSSEVINKNSLTTSATVVTGYGDMIDPSISMRGYMMLELGGRSQVRQAEESRWLPSLGKNRIFWVGFRPFLFTRTGTMDPRSQSSRYHTMNESGTPANSIMLYTPGWSLQPFDAFLKKCHDYKVLNNAGQTTIYFSSGGEHYNAMWSSVMKATRKLDTIDMDDDTKAELIRDAEYYYSAKCKKLLADCGVPYRRGYLFHGPPGTGKSSFCSALAGHLCCDVYVINLATGYASDGQLHRLFRTLPHKCIVVIEDIDTAGIGREQGPSSTVPMPPVPLPAHAPPVLGRIPRPRNKVTLSGLLNAIDSNTSVEGRLLIMTSNNPDVLDEALTRPGRIDRKFFFGKMMPKAAHDIFKRLIGRAAIESLGYTNEEVEEYATTFSQKIPPDTFTAAQIQGFLQLCLGDPIRALGEVDAWIKENGGQAPEDDKAEDIVQPQPKAGSDSSETLVEFSEGALILSLPGN